MPRGLHILVLVIFDGGQRPPAIGPPGMQRQSFCVQDNSFVEAILAAGLCGLFGKRFELYGVGGPGLRSRVHLRKRQDRKQDQIPHGEEITS